MYSWLQIFEHLQQQILKCIILQLKHTVTMNKFKRNPKWNCVKTGELFQILGMGTWNHYECTLYLKLLGLRMYKIQRRSANQHAQKWTFRIKRAPAFSSYSRVSRHNPLKITTQITWNQLTWHTTECWISEHQSSEPPPTNKSYHILSN